jgi:hypothetical protein
VEVRRTSRIVGLAFVAAWSAVLFGPWPLPALHAQEKETLNRESRPQLFEISNRSLAAYPYAYYTPETELAVGLGGILTFYTASDEPELLPSKVILSGYYSTRGQYEVSQTSSLYLQNNDYFLEFPISFGSFVDKFWGFGNLTEDFEEVDYDVTEFEWGVTLEGITPVKNLTRDGFVYRGLWRDITDVKENPELTEDLVGLEGGYSSGFGFDFVSDTRDHIFFPTSGAFHRLYLIWYVPFLGSEYRYAEVEWDMRRYFPMGDGDQLIAIQFLVEATFGETPFYATPAMGGGNIMRGYYSGRYRDQTLVAGQVEYRSPRWWRFSSVLFAGIGEVMGSHESEFSFSDLKYSLGGGLRFLFDKDNNINLRVDLGFGRDSKGLYFGLEEAF